jgi:hypothetical protein
MMEFKKGHRENQSWRRWCVIPAASNPLVHASKAVSLYQEAPWSEAMARLRGILTLPA